MKYKIVEWEDNGYHDSYFYGVFFDDATGLMQEICIGATAYAGGISRAWLDCALPTVEVVERCRLLLAEHIFTRIREAEHIDVFTPSDAKPGEVLVLLVPHIRQLKAPIPCEKCLGKGYWQNPRSATDHRPCFACNGNGTVAKGDLLCDASGKPVRQTIPEGSRLTVLAVTAFGRFYRKGYNKPGRENRSVTGRLDTGEVVHIPLKKLCLAKDPMPDAELRERAERLSHKHQYGAMFGCRAWLSENHAAAAIRAAQKDETAAA